MSRPRIGLVAAGPDIVGGQGVQAQALAAGLRAAGHAVTFIPINPRFPRGLLWLRRCPVLGSWLSGAAAVG